LRLACFYRGDLLEALRQLDEEEDVNKALKYFSYEHFYVIYCKVDFPPLNSSSEQNTSKFLPLLFLTS